MIIFSQLLTQMDDPNIYPGILFGLIQKNVCITNAKSKCISKLWNCIIFFSFVFDLEQIRAPFGQQSFAVAAEF